VFVLGREATLDVEVATRAIGAAGGHLVLLSLGYPVSPNQAGVVGEAVSLAEELRLCLDAVLVTSPKQLADLVGDDDQVTIIASGRERRRIERALGSKAKRDHLDAVVPLNAVAASEGAELSRDRGQSLKPSIREQPITPAASGVEAAIQALARLDVYEALGTSARGLTREEAAARLTRYGRNKLPKAKKRPLIFRFLEQFTAIFAVLLEVAAGFTFVAYFVQTPHDVGNLQLAVAILCVVLLNAIIGFFQEYSAERTAEALQALVPRASRVIRDGERVEVSAEELVPGDIVVLEPGDAISADARLVAANDLSVNNVALTGESDPVARTDDPVSETTDLIEARNCVYMGTSVVNGTGKGVVFATGLHTEFGRIFQLTAEVVEEKSPLQRQISNMAKRVAVAAIVLGVALFALRAGTGSKIVDAFILAMGIMVALVPEGLPATLSVSLAIGVRRMARRNALIKRLVSVETLGSTTVICTDKTGTLTKAEMTVQALWASGRLHAVRGVGYAPEGEVEGAERVRELLRAGALCADAKLLPPSGDASWRILGDTTEGAIVVAAAKAGVDVSEAEKESPRVFEYPFDSDRKLMSTVHRADSGFESFVKGSPQELLNRCWSVLWDGHEVPLDDRLRGVIAEANDEMARDALRVLAVARRAVGSNHPPVDECERDLVFLGLIGMLDPPRPEVVEAVRRCRGAGIRVIMVTGDYGLTAEAIARKVGIVTGERPRVVSGSDLEETNDDQLRALLSAHWEILFARVRPEHKMRVVAALKEMGEIVAVTGDGVNDAPALKRADIGVSMGLAGTDVAREASVMILLDDSFASIVAAVELGRSVYQNIRKFLIYLFSHNLAELAPILAATFVGFPLVAFSALQVLSIDLGSDVMPALALGAEKPEPGIMDRPPRAPSERLFSAAVVRRFLFLGTIQSIGVVFAFFWRIHTAHLPFGQFTFSNPIYREALTQAQAGVVVGQFFNGFAVRTDEESVFRVGLFSNIPLVLAECFGLLIMAAISYLAPLQAVFHTAPLHSGDWLIAVVFGVVLLAADELRKLWVRARRSSGHAPLQPVEVASRREA
jgi:Ca2+-transporting ATPase